MSSPCSVQHYGGRFDGSSANGWHVVVRPGGAGGSLEAIAGPFSELEEALEAAKAKGLEVGGINTEPHLSRGFRGAGDPGLDVRCGYCGAQAGDPCTEVIPR